MNLLEHMKDFQEQREMFLVDLADVFLGFFETKNPRRILTLLRRSFLLFQQTKYIEYSVAYKVKDQLIYSPGLLFPGSFFYSRKLEDILQEIYNSVPQKPQYWHRTIFNIYLGTFTPQNRNFTVKKLYMYSNNEVLLNTAPSRIENLIFEIF